jgi:glycosyltransferase involved in cell wall biosynthesis
MSQASVFAFPSLDEGSALVTYEAMAAGLPVIATPNAGSLVRDSIDGYLIPIRNSEALAERIEFFYHYPHQAVEMGRNGQERVGEFTWERYGEELVKAYIKMLK